MLRITVQPQASRTLLVLEGRLAGAWVEELRKVLTPTWSDPDAPPVTISLSAVSAVDTAGHLLLIEAHARGAELTGSGLTARALIEETKGMPSGVGHSGHDNDSSQILL
jgi:anti-anti-sigma regulatory factor